MTMFFPTSSIRQIRTWADRPAMRVAAYRSLGSARHQASAKVGPNSDARFRSQHYTTSGRSTLAKNLLAHRILWPWLGISQLDEATVKPWMLSNLDRMHIYVPAPSLLVLAALEMYVRARIGSVFEGSA
jgi:hypothetical protein